MGIRLGQKRFRICPDNSVLKSTMFALHSLILAATGLASIISAAAFQPRATIASDQIVGLPATVPSGATGAAYKAYQPFLYVSNGCVPFPAVDASGRTKSASFC